MSDADFVLLVMNPKTLGQTIHAAEVWAARKGLQAPEKAPGRPLATGLTQHAGHAKEGRYRLVTAAARPTLDEQCGMCGGSGKARTGHEVARVLDMFGVCLALDKRKMQKSLANA